MALLAGLPSAVPTPKSPAHPAGRYIHTNPLRREHGLRVLCEYLPEPLRWALIGAWRRPNRYTSANLALPNLHQQRPDDAVLLSKPPQIIGCLALVEFELARRTVEAPKTAISPAIRNALLTSQSLYLWRLYNVLVWQVGEAAALAEFEHLLACVD